MTWEKIIDVKGLEQMARWMVLTVTLVDREDGGLCVSSDDLPGLILSGSNKGKIAAAIAPTIRALLEHSGLKNVRVHHSTPPSEVLQKASPRSMDVHVQHSSDRVQIQQFVVEMEQLAA